MLEHYSLPQRIAESRAALAEWRKDGEYSAQFPGWSACFGLVYNCAVWRHPKAGWTPAPNHAGRIGKGKYGWEIEFGANKFLVDLAITMYCKSINSFLDSAESGQLIEYDGMLAQLGFIAPLSVSNFEGQRFSNEYPLQDGKLVFGTQAICNEHAVAYIVRVSKLKTIRV